jgi:hypothetical protein
MSQHELQPYYAPPTTLSIPQSTWTFFHVGKAGGGTHLLRTQSRWHLNVHQCHPHPCPTHKFQNLNEQFLHALKQNQPPNQVPKVMRLPILPHLTLSLRDPVDCFVSAFYWARNFVCIPPWLYASYNGSDSLSGSSERRFVVSPTNGFVCEVQYRFGTLLPFAIQQLSQLFAKLSRPKAIKLLRNDTNSSILQ